LPAGFYVKLAGFLLLIAGWGIALTALALLKSGLPRDVFLLAGIAVELLGFLVAARAHAVQRG